MRAEDGSQTMSTVIGASADGVLELQTAASDPTPLLQSQDSAPQRVSSLLRRAMLFLERDREAARQCLKEASALLQSEAQDSGAAAVPANLVLRPGGLARWQARRALTYIEANLGSKMDIRALAGVVEFSKSHFSRAFKRSLGLSPMAYVATRRVERAKVMMMSTREQLTEIALASGFADQSHLNRSFRRMVGTSPGLWRRAHAEMAGANPRRPGRVRSSPAPLRPQVHAQA
jgi:AraC family transcriptional regulator